jgi:DNA-binding NarL/FixJ family response regulator
MLLVIGATRAGAVREWLTAGGTTTALTRRPKCPVVVVPKRARAPDCGAALPGRTVFCGVADRDDVPCARTAAELADRLGLPFMAVHVRRTLPAVPVTSAGAAPVAPARGAPAGGRGRRCAARRVDANGASGGRHGPWSAALDPRGSAVPLRDPERRSARHRPLAFAGGLRTRHDNRWQAGAVPIRLLIADDHTLVRAGLRRILEDEVDFAVVAEAADGAEALAATLATEVDVAILDISMPKLTGLQAARRMLEHRPGLRILMLSMHDNEEFLFEALRVGASGYVLKSSAESDLVRACRTAVRGESFLYPKAVGALIRDYLGRVERGELHETDVLSSRETEIVKLIAEGHTSREIADILSISPNTVERHRHNVLEKLQLRDRVALTRYAVRRGLIEP